MIITISGKRGCGKSTLLKLLKPFLMEKGYLVGKIKFPDFGKEGEQVETLEIKGEIECK